MRAGIHGLRFFGSVLRDSDVMKGGCFKKYTPEALYLQIQGPHASTGGYGKLCVCWHVYVHVCVHAWMCVRGRDHITNGISNRSMTVGSTLDASSFHIKQREINTQHCTAQTSEVLDTHASTANSCSSVL